MRAYEEISVFPSLFPTRELSNPAESPCSGPFICLLLRLTSVWLLCPKTSELRTGVCAACSLQSAHSCLPACGRCVPVQLKVAPLQPGWVPTARVSGWPSTSVGGSSIHLAKSRVLWHTFWLSVAHCWAQLLLFPLLTFIHPLQINTDLAVQVKSTEILCDHDDKKQGSQHCKSVYLAFSVVPPPSTPPPPPPLMSTAKSEGDVKEAFLHGSLSLLFNFLAMSVFISRFLFTSRCWIIKQATSPGCLQYSRGLH